MLVGTDQKPAKPLAVILAILAIAAALTLPAALGPVRLNDSFWIDWVWLEQFASELGNGVLYPRWLPLSHDGLGSPVFYYYPPLAFYAASPFVLAGMSTYAALLTTFFVGYLLSGATMYWWLRLRGGNALLGALVFMIAPYHAFNFYERGAIAEFIATALIPLVMGGLWLVKHRTRGGFAIAAIGYAALIATHLPLALLASLFLFGPTLLLDGYRSPRASLPAVLALATGMALAAIYWVPAILLEHFRDSAKLWENPIVHPSNWSFWNPEFRTFAGYLAVLVIGAAIAFPLTSLVIRQRSRWAMLGITCVFLAIGAVPAIWSLPVIRSVQFPFRLFPVAEFALATGMAIVPWDRVSLGLALAPLVAISGFIVTAPPATQGVSIADVRTLHVDVPENLPPGQRPYSWPSRWAVQVAASHRVPQVVGGITIEPIFYFPAWQVRCDGTSVPTFAALDTQLLSYSGRNCTRTLGETRPEKIGALISLFGLFALIVVSASGRLRRKRALAGDHLAKLRKVDFAA
jgi:hypothetical protein